MKRINILLLLLALGAGLAGAQTQAVVKSFTGKVEVLQQAWVPVKAGMKLSMGTTISTGFNSSAVLELGPSVLQVKPLTRLRLNELVAREGTLKTDLFLRVGKVRAEVKTAEGLNRLRVQRLRPVRLRGGRDLFQPAGSKPQLQPRRAGKHRRGRHAFGSRGGLGIGLRGEPLHHRGGRRDPQAAEHGRANG
jgi:hypothetical protein